MTIRTSFLVGLYRRGSLPLRTTYSVVGFFFFFFFSCVFEGDSWQKSFELDQQLFEKKKNIYTLLKMTPDFITQLQILPDILAV